MHRRALKEDSFRVASGFRFVRDEISPFSLGEGLAGMILLSLALVAGVSIAFVVINHAALWLVPLALLPTIIMGVSLHFGLACVDRMWDWMVRRAGRLQAAFLLFFVYLPAFVALYFLFLAFPMGLALSHYATPELAADYRRWILDLAAVAAMLAWGRLIRRKL